MIRIMETRNNINPRPFQPVSPGCILKEELEARSLPISDFYNKRTPKKAKNSKIEHLF